MSEDVVEQLKLKVKSDLSGKPKFGYLGQQMFEFSGTVTLQWKCKDKSELLKCRVVPRQEFEVYVPSSMLPLQSPKERRAVIHNPLSSLPPTELNQSPPSAPTSSIEFSGAFDGDGLEDFLDTSKEYGSLLDYGNRI
jgi:hypothetical protein